MKIAYIGLDLFYPVLCTLKEIGCEIAEIFTCETDNVTEFNTQIIGFAKKYDIPYTTKRITINDIKRLKQKGCRMAICAGYYFRIPVDSEFPMVNIHPSLLPEGRGSWPMPVSILRGDKHSGVTIHKIAEGFDTGDILLQKSLEMSAKENLKSFMDKACSLAADMVRVLIQNFDDLYKNAIPQGAGEYIEAPSEKDWTVTENMTFEEADLIMRAFYGYECVYLSKDKKYILINARVVDKETDGKPCFRFKGGYIVADKVVQELDV